MSIVVVLAFMWLLHDMITVHSRGQRWPGPYVSAVLCSPTEYYGTTHYIGLEYAIHPAQVRHIVAI